MKPHAYLEHIGALPEGFASGLRSYLIGFILSLALTLATYAIAMHELFSPGVSIGVVMVFAAAQFLVQIFCFLHLGRGKASGERLLALGFAAVIAAILLSGSLWIMLTLANRTMPGSAQMEQYMDAQTGI